MFRATPWLYAYLIDSLLFRHLVFFIPQYLTVKLGVRHHVARLLLKKSLLVFLICHFINVRYLASHPGVMEGSHTFNLNSTRTPNCSALKLILMSQHKKLTSSTTETLLY